jgi:alpha-ketoglutarate-dependent taurine dioxygenase
MGRRSHFKDPGGPAEYKVLLIRGQAALSAQQLADFAANFGAPETRGHPVHGDFPGCPAVKMIRTDGDHYLSKTGEKIVASDADGWHTDGSTRTDTNEWVSFLFAQKYRLTGAIRPTPTWRRHTNGYLRR